MNDRPKLDHFLALDPATQFAVWDEVGKLYEREESFFLRVLYRILAERFPEVDSEEWERLHYKARHEAFEASEAAQKELQRSRHLAGTDDDLNSKEEKQ